MTLDVRTPAGDPSSPAGDRYPARRHPGRPFVTALVLDGPAPSARDAGPAAPDDLLAAVAGQTRPPDFAVGPSGSATTERGSDQSGPDQSGPDERSGDQGRGEDWLWLLREGSLPDPTTLEQLLSAVELRPSVGIAGCKQLDPSGARLLDAGFTSTRLGRHVTGVDRGDVDQGQLDHRDDVLAVSTAGMLVRRELFDLLRGTDPALQPPAADLDLCRRAWLAGHRVVVVPGATVRSAVRPALTRRDAAHLRLVHAPLPLLPLVAVALVLGAVGRLLVRAGRKDPGRGAGELGQALRALLRVDLVWRSRRRAARTRIVPRRSLTPLLARRRETRRWHRRGGSVDAAAQPRPPLRRRLVPPLVLAAVLGTVSLVALHQLLGAGRATGAAALAAPGSLQELWAGLRSSWRPASLGSAAPADPFGYVVAAMSLPFGGSPALVLTVLPFLALPLAAVGAWLAAGRATSSRVVRSWTAVAWAAAPALLLAAGSGRAGAVVVHVALPYTVWAVAACVQARGLRFAWAPAAGAGIALAVVTAAAPGLLVPGAVVLVAVAVTYPNRAPALVWTAVPSLGLLGPWLVQAVQHPRALLAAPGVPVAATPADGWAQLLGQPVVRTDLPPVAGLPASVAPVAACAIILVLALLALLRRGPAGRVVRLGWFVAAVGLATALVTSSVVVGTDGAGTVLGEPGAALSLELAGFGIAVVAGVSLRRRDVLALARGWRRVAAGAIAVVAFLAPLTALGVWAWQGVGGPGPHPVAGTAGPSLPEMARDAARSDDRARTLVLRATPDGVTAGLVRGGAPTADALSALTSADAVVGVGSAPWSDVVPADPDAADQALQLAVATLASGRTDPRPVLSDLAVGYVVVLPGDGADRLASVLGSVPGLALSGRSDDVRAWRVRSVSGQGGRSLDRPAALRVLDASGAPTAVLAAGAVGADTDVPAARDGQERLLVLSERRDDGWSATLDGHRLRPASSAGWAQAFELPAAGGHLVVEHTEPWQMPWTVVQLVVGALTLLLAVPLGRPGSRPLPAAEGVR